MRITRSQFLKILFGLFFSINFAWKTSYAVVKEIVTGKTSKIMSYFKNLGYEKIEPLGLITNHKFNGGLRYDVSQDAKMLQGKRMRLQPCSRIEDLKKIRSENYLPYFHILSLTNSNPKYKGELLCDILDFLINDISLDKNNLYFISTQEFKPYYHILEQFKINTDQIKIRSLKEAMSKGDGSGYFAPRGHPHNLGQYTASIHYLEANSSKSRKEQMAKGHLELGEYVISDKNFEEVGCGYERIQFVSGKTMPDYNQSRLEVLSLLRSEAEKTGVPLPKGYYMLEEEK
ncbi:MAG: hypothetical protein GY710_22190 [Desulfobacteraceae bacterium]|nr:hypothetical protein [Desulfobacteraceae bacterium]